MPEEVMLRIEDYMKSGVEFLVGDAPGIDTRFQQILAKHNYRNVTVLSSADEVRNNVGKWNTRFVESGLKSKSHARHAAKDRFMTSQAEAGVMIWDKESPGTIANVIDLVKSGKHCLVFVAGDNNLVNISNNSELENLLINHLDVRDEAQKRLIAYDRRLNKKVPFNQTDSLFD